MKADTEVGVFPDDWRRNYVTYREYTVVAAWVVDTAVYSVHRVTYVLLYRTPGQR